MAKARKSKAAKPPVPKSPPRELVTVLDYVRYAVTRFGQAQLAFGQGTYDAAEEATFLVGAGAHLRPDGGLLCEVGRGRHVLERDHPRTEFLWLDTAESVDEVFWIAAPALRR